MSNDSNDNFLKWVLEKEQALISEYEQHGFISVFVTTFIDAGMSRAKLNIEEITELKNHNSGEMEFYENAVRSAAKGILKEFRRITAQHNQALDDLDNGLLVLERMKEFVNSNIKKCEGQWRGCDKVGLDPHTCPFASEIYDDNKLCNCCENCQDSCNDEI